MIVLSDSIAVTLGDDSCGTLYRPRKGIGLARRRDPFSTRRRAPTSSRSFSALRRRGTPARVLNFTPIGSAGFSSIDDGNGRQLLWNFGLDIFADSFTDPKGNTTSYSFLPGSATSTTTRPVPWEQLFQVYTPDAPNVPNTEYDYDTLGRIAQIKDAENLQIGDRAPYQFYIADGTRGERDDPLGDAWSVAYDVYGHPATYTDEDGNITTDLADGRGRVVQTTYPEGDQEQFQFDDNNNVLQLTKIP